MIYLDNAATTQVRPEVLQAAWPWLTTEFGNPSSTHELGLSAKNALQDARERVARSLGGRASEVIFTSGGTEGDNLAIIGLALANPRGKHIISARTEHEAVLASLDFLERVHGFEISWLPVDTQGQISLDALHGALRADSTLVSLMLANNEIGTIHPVAAIAVAAHEVGALVHTDAVQAIGWLPVDVADLGVDALTLSGHKVNAPKGSGALWLRSGLAVEPLLHGGGQEHERRSGTENVAWAVALASALEALPSSRPTSDLQEQLVSGILASVSNAALTGPDVGARHPGICSFVFPGINGETLLLELEQRGVVVSSGAACAAGKDEPSHVLLATGRDESTSRTAVRFSLARETTTQEIAQAIDATTAAYATVANLGG